MKQMDLWRCNTRISWYLQFFSLIFYGTLALVILSAPWPTEYSFLWGILLIAIVILALLAQKRLINMRGEIVILKDQGLKIVIGLEEWLIEHKPFTFNGVIFFKLKAPAKNKRKYLVLAYDNMTREAWHSLQNTLIQHFDSI